MDSYHKFFINQTKNIIMLKNLIAGAIVGLLFLIYSGVVITYTVSCSAYVVLKFWYWFLLPILPSLPHIVWVQALALSFVLQLFKNSHTSSIKKEYTDSGMSWFLLIVGPWLTLLVGYIFKSIFLS
jgi:hypothetical protein